jgi:tetratricopeptide (TPR) repeat protein
MSRLSLPPAPPSLTGPVKAWAEPVVLSTYAPAAADLNPMFLEKRVYQGSSGRVYPLPFIDRIANEAHERSWEALHLENEYLRVILLPEIGGRIHVGLDKTNNYDFFYRQNVIKPALVGLAGPWLSGGVEFNWPQHHRPATYMPVDFEIEESADGARTIWCSDHDPLTRLKGMHGVCLYPGCAYIELKVCLYNRTPFVQTFLWWANVGTHVHEQYQSFFPPDVHFVADHARRAISAFPLCDGSYYGVDYGRRARDGVAAAERPARCIPPGSYAANDLSWYANIPVPTSYMALESSGNFSGGYDHRRQAGLVHVANHHISPGKKQWTWGNHEFGYAWDRNLTNEDGPYIELMAGVYTDNQPDFSFLAPGETKTFSQFWYPIQTIGPVQEANTEAALSLKREGEVARVGLCTTRAWARLRIQMLSGSELVAEWIRDQAPGTPFQAEARIGDRAANVTARVVTNENRELIRYTIPSAPIYPVPRAATEPPLPRVIASSDELFLTGLHLDQYRHATRYPETYWQEALRRDSGDARANHALGVWHLRRGEFNTAEKLLRRAIERLTYRNSNPYDGEPFYSLGLTLRYLGNDNEAYAAFYKATWNYGWRSAGYFALSELDVRRGAFEQAWEHLKLSLRSNADHSNVRNLAVIVLRKLERGAEADKLLAETLALDPLDYWARFLAGRPLGDNQDRLDVAFDMMRSGLLGEAKEVLTAGDFETRDGSVAMIFYTLGHIAELGGDQAEAHAAYSRAAAAAPDYCFPSRLDEMQVLEAALARNPADARAHYYLGNWLYDRRRHEEAIMHWERSVVLDPAYSVPWRNLGIAYFNVRNDAENAQAAFDHAVRANRSDARLRYERDQLLKRIGIATNERLTSLEACFELVNERDDLTVELASLYNQTGQPGRAQALLANRRFHPWEGGEGAVLGQYARTHLSLARGALEAGDVRAARKLLEDVLHPPENLGEAWHLLANRSNVYYWLGVTCDADEDTADAHSWWTRAAESSGDFQDMSVREFSEMTYYSALALKRLNRAKQARQLLRDLFGYARRLVQTHPDIDFFATSLPAMLLFNDDLEKRNLITSLFLESQACFGLGYTKRGERLLQRVLRLDPNHALAADLSAEFHTTAKLGNSTALKA